MATVDPTDSPNLIYATGVNVMLPLPCAVNEPVTIPSNELVTLIPVIMAEPDSLSLPAPVSPSG